MKLRYTDRAKDDVELAFAWYERQRRGLGFEFLDCVENAVKSIIENPTMYRNHYLNFRGCVVRRFPFSVFYTVEERAIVVHRFSTIGKIRRKGHNHLMDSYCHKKRSSFLSLLWAACDVSRSLTGMDIQKIEEFEAYLIFEV